MQKNIFSPYEIKSELSMLNIHSIRRTRVQGLCDSVDK
jgi:hypothetical protein